MDSSLVRIAIAGLFFVFIFISGMMLSRAGMPYNSLMVSVHKFIVLGALAFLGIMAYRIQQDTGLESVQVLAAVVTGLFFVVGIFSGGLMSALDSPPSIVSTVHGIIPYVTVVSSAVLVYLLVR